LNEEVFQRDFSPWFSLAASSSEARGAGRVE
jgi:hypothetical protein